MEKIFSRKFILSLLSAISGIAIALTQIGGKCGAIAAIVSACVPVVTYIIVEGTIDAKAVDMIKDATINVAETVEKINKEGDANDIQPV